MKILQVHENYKQWGGAETYFSSLCNELSKHNKVFVYSIGKEEEIKDKDKFIYKIPRNRIKRFLYSYFNFPLYIKFRQWLKQIKPDIAHLHINSEYCTAVLLALKKEKIPVVQTVHDFSIVCPTTWCIRKNKICKGGFGFKCINSWCKNTGYYGKKSYLFILFCGLREKIKDYFNKRYVDVFICPSKALENSMLKNKFGNITHIPNFTNKTYPKKTPNPKQKNVLYVGMLTKQKGVNYLIKAFRKVSEKIPTAKLKIVGEDPKNKILHLPYFIDEQKKARLSDNKKESITYSGRLIKQKGVNYLIKAFSVINRKVPTAKLTVIGEGDEKEKLIKLSKKLNLKNIEFLGKIPNSKIHQYYQDSTVVVIPSVWMENNPIVAYEAMAAGRPLIGSNIGGIPELVQDGKNGFLFEPKNNNQLAERIIKILDSPKLARKFGKYGKNLINDKFNKKRHIKNIISIYKTIILTKKEKI